MPSQGHRRHRRHDSRDRDARGADKAQLRFHVEIRLTTFLWWVFCPLWFLFELPPLARLTWQCETIHTSLQNRTALSEAACTCEISLLLVLVLLVVVAVAVAAVVVHLFKEWSWRNIRAWYWFIQRLVVRLYFYLDVTCRGWLQIVARTKRTADWPGSARVDNLQKTAMLASTYWYTASWLSFHDVIVIILSWFYGYDIWDLGFIAFKKLNTWCVLSQVKIRETHKEKGWRSFLRYQAYS